MYSYYKETVKLSTKGRYAVRAMLDLAQNSIEGPVLTREVSCRQEISALYLAQLFNRLSSAGLVRSMRGSRGGFTLARPASQISLLDIIQAVEGSTAPVACVDNVAVCPRALSCPTRTVWMQVKAAIDHVLSSSTLDDLACQLPEKASMYEV